MKIYYRLWILICVIIGGIHVAEFITEGKVSDIMWGIAWVLLGVAHYIKMTQEDTDKEEKKPKE